MQNHINSDFKFEPSDSVLKKIHIIPTNERLTDAAGLGTLVEIFDQSGLKQEFINCLPKRTSSRSLGSYRLALNMIAGFIYGFDTLDDFDDFEQEEGLKALFGEDSPKGRTLGDFLRDFEEEHLDKLNHFLSKMSYSMMQSLEKNLPEDKKPKHLILDIDSTSHPQSGNKIEGVAWNYKKEWCLDSQEIFNQLGFCHSYDLRPGNTKSGVGAAEQIASALLDKRSPRERRLTGDVFIRGDSAYCFKDLMQNASTRGALFTLTAHDGTTNWKDLMAEAYLDWKPWVYSEEEIKKAQERGTELPTVDTAYFYWTPPWSEKEGKKLVFPIVVKRTLDKEKFAELRRKNEQIRMFQDDGYLKEDPYDYYAVVTNFPLDVATEKVTQTESESKMKRYSPQEVLTHHQKRGNMENFIREDKNAYDLKHFPCLKLKANHAYGLLAMVAHNLLRWVALIMKPDKPHFAKKLRKRIVFAAGKVIKHAGKLYLKIVAHAFQEVMKLREAWGFTPAKIPSQYSSA
jgi:hypothetical protein